MAIPRQPASLKTLLLLQRLEANQRQQLTSVLDREEQFLDKRSSCSCLHYQNEFDDINNNNYIALPVIHDKKNIQYHSRKVKRKKKCLQKRQIIWHKRTTRPSHTSFFLRQATLTTITKTKKPSTASLAQETINIAQEDAEELLISFPKIQWPKLQEDSKCDDVNHNVTTSLVCPFSMLQTCDNSLRCHATKARLVRCMNFTNDLCSLDSSS